MIRIVTKGSKVADTIQPSYQGDTLMIRNALSALKGQPLSSRISDTTQVIRPLKSKRIVSLTFLGVPSDTIRRLTGNSLGDLSADMNARIWTLLPDAGVNDLEAS